MADARQIAVPVQLLHRDAVVPAYAKHGDAGADLSSVAELTLAPGERHLVPTGVAMAIPHGWVGLVHPRSGLAARHGISVVNAPGTVDSGYRGEILVNLVNLDPTDSFTVHVGDRVAQLVLQEVGEGSFEPVDSLPPSQRGETGHGSSGGFGPPSTTGRE
ncbi:dUTP diphosphatase [Janibacter hoylei]|uniref:dUTP diphosphatase n=1 Tax=Janibacter hoylei TaxID=364298 RepID=UPI0027B91DEF|nr:dUTP diphosphatase [Janibacter hoylei]